MPAKKTQLKTRKFLKWLRPNSPAKTSALFVIVFAIIGGGYLLFNSFAANTTIPYTCNTPHPQIGYGSTGSCVKYVQWTLNSYFGQKLNIDGIYGSVTKLAVEQFQTLGSIPVDGIVGPITWQHVDSAVNPFKTSTLNPSGTTRMACIDMTINGGHPTSISHSQKYTFAGTILNSGNVTWYNGAYYNPAITNYTNAWASYKISGGAYDGLGGLTAPKPVYPGQTITISTAVGAGTQNTFFNTGTWSFRLHLNGTGGNVGPNCIYTLNVT